MVFEIRADVRRELRRGRPICLVSAFDAELYAPPRHKRQFADPHPLGDEAVIRSAGTVNLSDQGRERPSCARPYAGVAGSRHMFIAFMAPDPKSCTKSTASNHARAPGTHRVRIPRLHQEVRAAISDRRSTIAALLRRLSPVRSDPARLLGPTPIQPSLHSSRRGGLGADSGSFSATGLILIKSCSFPC